ncbi:MAG: DUF479 domain-containing protein, partial [Coleofasciculaceae cyanobacterium SM2_3_26]|nr:DUF479 domain-containing protein [Coleofasciculaceae cyanobacterium SM2_3_26]
MKVVLDKFCEGVAYKLGDKAVEALPEKVKQLVKRLGQLVWTKCLRGKPGTEQLLQQAADGSAAEQEELKKYLHQVLESDTDLQQEAKKLAEEIHQVIQFEDVNARNVQQIFGGQGLQVNERQEQPIIQIQGNPTLKLLASLISSSV